MMILGDKLCDVCGAPATIMERGVREVMPSYSNGWLWRELVPTGQVKFGCVEHWPEAEYEKWPPKMKQAP